FHPPVTNAPPLRAPVVEPWSVSLISTPAQALDASDTAKHASIRAIIERVFMSVLSGLKASEPPSDGISTSRRAIQPTDQKQKVMEIRIIHIAAAVQIGRRTARTHRCPAA